MPVSNLWLPVLLTNLAALLVLFASIYRPLAARVLFSLLFAWAAFTNWEMAHFDPRAYLQFASFASFSVYVDFINGFFSDHITSLVSFIAVCQLLIAVFLLWKGNIFFAGCLAGICFLLAIAPLGRGSAFPSTLVMAVALAILWKKHNNRFAWQKPGTSNRPTKTQDHEN